MGVGDQRHAPAALPTGKTRYPLYRRLGGPQDRSGRVRQMSPPPRFDPRTVQPVESRYTDWALPAHNFVRISKNNTKYQPNYSIRGTENSNPWPPEYEAKSSAVHSTESLDHARRVGCFSSKICRFVSLRDHTLKEETKMLL